MCDVYQPSFSGNSVQTLHNLHPAPKSNVGIDYLLIIFHVAKWKVRVEVTVVDGQVVQLIYIWETTCHD